MINILLILVSVFCYLSAAFSQAFNLYKHNGLIKINYYVISFATFALCIHAGLLYQWIDVGIGQQNLSFFNVISQISWLLALIILILIAFKPLANLGILMFPLAALSIFLAAIFPGKYILHTAAHPLELIHIVMSFLAVSIFFLATTQALLLAMQNRLLRQRYRSKFLRILPPLETMEHLLFQLIKFGFVLLTLMIVSSILFFPVKLTPELIQHSLLATFAWIVFAILLGCRKKYGWRGPSAVRWTLIGFILLLLSYFAARILLKFCKVEWM